MLELPSGISIAALMALCLAGPAGPFQITGLLQSRTPTTGLSLVEPMADRGWRDVGACAQAGFASPPVSLEDIAAVVRM